MNKPEAVKPLAERRARWRALVDQARESGERPRQFCQARGVDLDRFYYWRRVFAQQEAPANPAAHFALVRRGRERQAEPGDLELQVDHGWRLRIPCGVNEATLRAVLGALRQGA